MRILGTGEEDLAIAAKALREGKLVAIPTETVYGLGANAFDERAVARVFEAKARPTFDPLIVHIAHVEEVHSIAREIPAKALQLAEALWPGPLTLILPKKPEVPDIVTAGLDTVAVRLPNNSIARRIIELAHVPVAAPSANPFGYISPTTAAHVATMLGERIDYIVDGGPCEVGVESTVIDLTGIEPALLRAGGMPLERIEAVIGAVRIPKPQNVTREAGFSSPGQTLSHYAPSTPLFLYEAGALPRALRDSEILHPCLALASNATRAHAFKLSGKFDEVEVLSPRGDLAESAARLFSLLHESDARHFQAIYAERVAEEGLGRAINDRLYRASRK